MKKRQRQENVTAVSEGMRRWGVAAKLVGAIVVTIMIVVAVLLLIVYNCVSDTLLEQSEKLLQQTTDKAIQETNAWMNKTMTMLTMQRDTIEYEDMDVPASCGALCGVDRWEPVPCFICTGAGFQSGGKILVPGRYTVTGSHHGGRVF